MTEGVSGHPSGAVGATPDEQLASWIDALLATPGLTAIRERDAAWRQHVDDSLAALPLLRDVPGPLVDVGSGGGAPGLALAAHLPDREVTLLEASGRKCDFLRAAARRFPNVRVVHGRAEEQPTDAWAAAVAKALAPPPVAAEWCLPLVRPGGLAALYVTDEVDLAPAAVVATTLAAEPPELVPVAGRRALLAFRKRGPTPPGFPRRPGAARKRPLA